MSAITKQRFQGINSRPDECECAIIVETDQNVVPSCAQGAHTQWRRGTVPQFPNLGHQVQTRSPKQVHAGLEPALEVP
jgi:hypothetical protein